MKKLLAMTCAVACLALTGCIGEPAVVSQVTQFDDAARSAFRNTGQFIIMRPGAVWAVRTYEIPEQILRESAQEGATVFVSQVTIIDRKQ